MLLRALIWGQRTKKVSEDLVCTVWGVTMRHLLTAGVCEQHFGASHGLLPTAGVCEHQLGKSLRLLLTAGANNV